MRIGDDRRDVGDAVPYGYARSPVCECRGGPMCPPAGRPGVRPRAGQVPGPYNVSISAEENFADRPEAGPYGV